MSGKEAKPKIDKVRFLYHINDEKEPIYINGVYGGITPRGDLLCHFFYEYTDIPLEDKAAVIEGQIDTTMIEHQDRVKHEENEIVLRRDIRASLIIPVQQIQNMAEWMIRKLDESRIIVKKETEEIE